MDNTLPQWWKTLGSEWLINCQSYPSVALLATSLMGNAQDCLQSFRLETSRIGVRLTIVDIPCTRTQSYTAWITGSINIAHELVPKIQIA